MTSPNEFDREKLDNTENNYARWKAYLFYKIKVIASHTCLFIFFITYLVIGALIFMYIESPTDMELNKEFLSRREELIQDIIDLTNCSSVKEAGYNDSAETIRKLLLNFETLLLTSVPNQYVPSSETNIPANWDISRAIFFTTTTITTIGYGRIVPVTKTGRVVCMVYSLFGIPFALLVFYDIGELIARWIRSSLKLYKKRKLKSRHIKMMKRQKREERLATIDLEDLKSEVGQQANKLSDIKAVARKHNNVDGPCPYTEFKSQSPESLETCIESLDIRSRTPSVSEESLHRPQKEEEKDSIGLVKSTPTHGSKGSSSSDNNQAIDVSEESLHNKNESQIVRDINSIDNNNINSADGTTESSNLEPPLETYRITDVSEETLHHNDEDSRGSVEFIEATNVTRVPENISRESIIIPEPTLAEDVSEQINTSNDHKPRSNTNYYFIPMLLALFLLFAYIFIFAAVTTYTGNLDIYEAVYFSFITFTTIGFGDIMPANNANHWSVVLLYLFFVILGLIIFSLTINVSNQFFVIYFQKLAAKSGYYKIRPWRKPKPNRHQNHNTEPMT